MWGSLAVLLAALLIAIGPRVRLSEWQVSRNNNTALDEALQWRRGTMALTNDGLTVEATKVGNHKYNVVGQAFVLISVAGTWLSEALGGGDGDFSGPLYVAMIALPLPFVAFGAFRAVTGRSDWGAFLAGGLIAATSLAPVLAVCRIGAIYYINHVLAVMGLMLISADLLGARRMWPSIVGLALAAWSRQMTCFYAIPILVVAWSGETRSGGREAVGEARSIRRRRIIATIGVILVAAFPMALNAIKFGNPLDTGYSRMYGDRTNQISMDGKAAFWGLRWYPKHLKAMNLSLPDLDIRQNAIHLDNTDREGGSIWVTTPIVLGIFVFAKWWWRDPAARALMLTTIPVILVLLGYHTTGAHQAGYYRYSLDFMPVWLMVIAPRLVTPRAAPWTVAAITWSALYFHLLPV